MSGRHPGLLLALAVLAHASAASPGEVPPGGAPPDGAPPGGVPPSEPLYVRNLSPVANLLGLPSQRDANATPRGRLAAALHSAIASHYINDSKSDEFLNVDGETVRVALELRYGLLDNLDLQLEVPWVRQDGGELDGLIDDWHDLWGMSDGGRSEVPRDMLDYRYLTPQGGFGLRDGSSGLGDVSASLNYAFYRDGGATAALAVGYKFGSGDDEDFTGSGADDAWVALRLSGMHLADLPLGWHGQVGYLYAGNSDLMESFQQDYLWFAGIAMDWRISADWSLIAQLDSHAAPLDSDITGVGDDAFLATVGARWRFAPAWSADLSVVEDIAVETAADVAFQASLRYRPD